MSDNDVLRMQKLVDTVLGMPLYTYPMLKNQPKPPGAFAAVKKLGELNPGRDAQLTRHNPDGSYTLITEGVRILTFQVLFTEGDDLVSRFISGFRRQDVYDKMVELELSILRHKPVTNSSLTMETNWEIRDSVLLECMSKRRYEYTETYIDEVYVDGEYHDVDEIIPIDIHINTKEPE